MSGIFLAAAPTVYGQEAPRSSLARRIKPPQLPTDYNIKAGQVFLNFNARLREEYVDNVNLSSGTILPIEGDLISAPELSIEAIWPISKLNTLRLSTGISYTKYLTHPELDTKTLLLAPDSELVFNVVIGDFKFQLHDRFSLQEDPVDQSGLSNVAKFGRFTNTIGTSVLWDLNDVKMSLGYDHTTFLALGATGAGGTTATSQNLESLNRSTDQISSYIIAELSSSLGIGLEATASTTRYPLAPQNDDKRVTFGPFISTQLTRYTQLDVAFGYQVFASEAGNADTQNTPLVDPLLKLENRRLTDIPSQPTSGGDSSSYYATARIDHRLNRFYKDTFAIGHESQTGLLGEQVQTDYLRYSSSWQINPRATLESAIFYESNQESGNLASDPFVRVGTNFNLRYQMTRKMNASLFYEYTQKRSPNEDFSYRQNRLGLTLNYKF